MDKHVIRHLMLCCAALSTGAVATRAAADPSNDRFSLTVGVSTFGANLEGTYQINDKWRLRGVYSASPNVSFNSSVGDIAYKFSWDGYGLALLGEYQIAGSPFFVTAGLAYSEQRIAGRTSGTILVNDDVYNTTLDARAQFKNRVLPVLAISLEVPFAGNVLFSGSAGVAYSGGVEATLTATGGGVAQDDILAETIDFENDFPDYYPFLTVGLKYRF